MQVQPVRFSDGASYDAMMGGWSRSVGEQFLHWLRPAAGLDWIDVGCGSGAFTSLVVDQCAPRSVLGLDPSPAQLDFARSRGLGPAVRFETGDAMALGAADASADAAAAALVVHFMPDPARGVAEMARVVRPGGLVAAYAWDLSGGGFPYDAVHAGLRGLGLSAPEPPHPEAAETGELARLWRGAGLEEVAQRTFEVSQRFPDFDAYWQVATTAPRIAAALAELDKARLAELRRTVSESLQREADGAVRPRARANAIAGRVPRG